MFGWFKRDPAAALQKQVDRKYTQSVALQRNGRLREYGALMKEIEGLEQQLDSLKDAGSGQA